MSIPRTHRRPYLGILGALGAVTLALTGCSAGSGASTATSDEELKPVVLNFSTFAPDVDNPHGLSSQWFMDAVTERTGGRVTFNASFLEAACPAAETFQCVSDGRADVAFAVPTFEPQKFPITLITGIPYMSESNDQQVQAFKTFYENSDELQEEYASQDLRLLGYWPSRVVIGGRGEPFHDVADLKNKSIRTTGGPITNAFSMVGANPVAMTTNEVYEALQRGIVDGYTFPLEGILTYGLSDNTDFIVDSRGLTSNQTFVMNSSVYDGLDDEAKKVIDEVAAELPDYAIDLIASRVDEGCLKLIEDTDVKDFIGWSQGESDAWSDTVSDKLRADWEQSAAENGVADPAAVFDQWVDALDGVKDLVPDAEVACAQAFKKAN